MATHNVNLTDRLSTFLEDQVRNGRHQNASEVMREALRRYEAALAAEQCALDAIRQAVKAAVDRGDPAALIRAAEIEAVLRWQARTLPGKSEVL